MESRQEKNKPKKSYLKTQLDFLREESLHNLNTANIKSKERIVKDAKEDPKSATKTVNRNNTDFSPAVLKTKKTRDNIFQVLTVNDYQQILTNLTKLLKLENKDISK